MPVVVPRLSDGAIMIMTEPEAVIIMIIGEQIM